MNRTTIFLAAAGVLALIAVIAYFFIPAWRRPLVWVAGVLAAGGSFGAVLAASSGESLREHVTDVLENLSSRPRA